MIFNEKHTHSVNILKYVTETEKEKKATWINKHEIADIHSLSLEIRDDIYVVQTNCFYLIL